MPKYTVTHPTTGKKITLTGTAPPSESELDNIFAQTADAPSSTIQGNPDASAADTEKMRRDFIRQEGTLGTRIKERVKSMANPAEIPRFAAEMVTVPLSEGLRGLKSVASTVQAGGEAIRQGSLDAGLQKYAEKQAEFRPLESPLQPSEAGQMIGEGFQRGVNKLSNLTGRPDIVEPVAQGVAGITSLMGLKASMPAIKAGARGLADLPSAAVRAVADNTKIPETLYGSAVKLPLSKKWTRTMGPEELSKRQDAIAAGLANEIYPTEYGVAKAKQLKKEAVNTTEAAVNELDAMGNVLPKSRLAKGLSDAQRVATTEGSEAAQKAVNNLLSKRFNKKGEMLPGELAVDDFGNPVQLIERFYKASELQDIKQQLYTMSDYEKAKLSRGLYSQIKELGNKGMAHEAMVMLEELNPELKTMNRNTAAYMSLVDGIESAANRIQNTNPISLGSKVLAAGNIGLAVLNQVLGVPAVKSKVAFLLNKARTNPASIKTGELRATVTPVTPVLPPQPYPAAGRVNSGRDNGPAPISNTRERVPLNLPVGQPAAMGNQRIPLNLPVGSLADLGNNRPRVPIGNYGPAQVNNTRARIPTNDNGPMPANNSRQRVPTNRGGGNATEMVFDPTLRQMVPRRMR